MPLKPACALVCVFALLVTGRDVRAADPAGCGMGHSWVSIEPTADLPVSLQTFVGLLRAELASRGIDLCPTDDGARGAPLARIHVAARPGAIALEVDVRDEVTSKHLGREVDLASIPPDGQPLTLALAADELLRASWAELALATAPAPTRAVPMEVSRTLRESIASPTRASAHYELGVSFGVERYARGALLYGPDARLGGWLSRRLEVAARFGLRTGPAIEAVDGAAQPSAWSAGLAGIYTLTSLVTAWGLDGEARLDAERVTFAAIPRAGASGSERSGYAVLASVGPQAWFAMLPALRLGVEVLATIPLRGVEAADANERFTGVAGIGWTAQAGIGSTL
ncbi:MAG TPA: hypothetical protein VGG39_31210 [Polyangiaceae bacterium]|jgi:hypothetical protein